MEVVAVLAGSSITLGVAASSVVFLLKKVSWFPVFQNQPMRSRLVVAVACLLLNILSQYINGQPIMDWATGLETFVSYLTAAATYDHLFKS